ncbi:hypothetical protein BLL42_23515 [Pseudomonas frederiksbergensis]|uniref:Putative tail fiber protein gp53-like C-terminal domain-containing protein n=1 Tax=Pseudomonas frederiksbergensis TaxID=104087 RepID=A0A1J0ERA1_9PSED|nr:hypothetical protein [Pseudomonas frederiksbergensis]APC18534.1 hypothetical protein BLL42_23515 [Pseudomonas frederiksbergensis]
MADLPESNEWALGVYQLETSDPVLGGPEGIDNLQAKQLASRTKWLRDQIQKIINDAAPLASPTFTGDPKAPTPLAGDNDLSVSNTEFVRTVVHGNTFIDVSGSGVLTLSAAQAGTGTLSLYGTLTGSRTIIVPTLPARYQVVNGTDGAFSLIVKTAGGSGVAVTQGTSTLLFVTGANTIAQQQSDFDSINLTGNPITPTPPPGDNDKSVANTEFVQAAINGAGSVNIAGAGSIALTATQLGTGIVYLSGVLTGNKTVIVPSAAARFQMQNITTGAFTVTVRTAMGAGIVITPNTSSLLFCDGTNVQLQQSDFISPVLRGIPKTSQPPRFDVSDQVMSTAAAQARGHQLSGFWSFAGPTVGIVAHVGGVVHCSGSGTNAYSLPDATANSIPVGAVIRVQNWGITTLYLNVQGADKMQENIDSSWTAATRSIPPDSHVDCMYIGTNYWLLTGTGVVGKTRPWGCLLGTSGYQKLPSGLIMQWFTASFLSAFKAAAFNLPIAFPGMHFGCHVSLTDSAIYDSAGTPFVAGMPNGLGQVLLQSNYTASQSAVRVLAFGI